MKIYLLAMVVILSACTGLKDAKQAKDFNEKIAQGEVDKAEKIYEKETGLLSQLNLAMLNENKGDWAKSNEYLTKAEQDLLWSSDSIQNADELLTKGMELILSDNISEYKGQIYEGVLINNFKALHYMLLGDNDKARIEFNRASARAQNAVDQLGEKVKAIKNSTEKPDGYSASFVKENLKDPELESRRKAIEDLGTYKNLLNPFLQYMHGVFRYETGEYNRAADLFRLADVLTNGKNDNIRHLWADAENRANKNLPAPKPRIYIVHFDGSGPKLREWRKLLHLPTRGLGTSFGIALPEFVNGQPAFGNTKIIGDGEPQNLPSILNMNIYANTEFKAGYDAVVTKAIISAVTKAIIQEAGKSISRTDKTPGIAGALFDILVTATAIISTRADVRSWNSLPNTVHIGVMDKGNNNELQWVYDNKNMAIPVPAGPNSVIIFIKTINKTQPPLIASAVIKNN